MVGGDRTGRPHTFFRLFLVDHHRVVEYIQLDIRRDVVRGLVDEAGRLVRGVARVEYTPQQAYQVV